MPGDGDCFQVGELMGEMAATWPAWDGMEWNGGNLYHTHHRSRVARGNQDAL